jgi:hypothetical protein
MSTYSLSELIDYKNISGKFTMQQTRSTIYPYENTKLETNCLGSYSSTAMLNMHPSAAATTTVTAEKAELIIIGSPLIGANKADKEEGGLVKISLNDINLEQERRVVIDDLQPYPQEPATATVKASSRNLVDYEFMKFEPINLDLMLPSTSELLKAARRKIKEKNHYYHYS